jgi:hypothetical protein
MGAPHTKTTDELVEWARDLYVEFGKVLTDRSKIGGDFAQARRDLEELRARFGVSEHVGDNRCPSCEHRISMHGDDGCLQEIGYGPGDEPCCCPCTTGGIAQAGTGDTTQPDDDAIDRAARDLHRWNTEDTWHPRFVIHDLGDQDEDPYVALVRKVAGLLLARSDTQDSAGWTSEPRFAAFREAYGYATSHFTVAGRAFSKITREEAFSIWHCIQLGMEKQGAPTNAHQLPARQEPDQAYTRPGWEDAGSLDNSPDLRRFPVTSSRPNPEEIVDLEEHETEDER